MASAQEGGAVCVANAIPHPPVNGNVALVSRQIQIIRIAGATAEASCHPEITGLVRVFVAHVQRHRAVKTDGVVDECALAQAHGRAIGKHRGVAGAKDFQRLAFDGTSHFHLAAHAFGLNHQRHRHGQRCRTATHRNRVGTAR